MTAPDADLTRPAQAPGPLQPAISPSATGGTGAVGGTATAAPGPAGPATTAGGDVSAGLGAGGEPPSPHRPGRLTGRRRRASATWRDRLAPVVLFAVIIGVWYFVSLVVLDPDRRFLLPAPHEVVRVAFLDPDNLEQLLRALWLSTKVALIGLGVSIALGMAVAIAMSQARWVEKSVYPYAVILQTIPTLALVPLIGFWFHYGFLSRVIVCVLIALFPIISSTLFGLQSVDQGALDLFRLHGVSRRNRLLKLQLPAALPATFAGFQVSAGLSVVGAVVGDFFFKQGKPGIGVLIDLYRARLLSEQLLGAVILASLLGVVVFTFFGWLSRLVTGHWYGAETS